MPQSESALHFGGGGVHVPFAESHLPPLTVRLVLPHAPLELLHFWTVSTQPSETSRQLGVPQSESALHFGGGGVHVPLAESHLPPLAVRLVLPHAPLELLQTGVVCVQPPDTSLQVGGLQSASALHLGGATHLPVAGAHQAPGTLVVVTPQVPVAESHLGVVTSHPPDRLRQFGTPQSRSLLHFGGGVALHRPVAATQLPPVTVRLVLPQVPDVVSHRGVVSVQPPATSRQLTWPQSTSALHFGGGGVTHLPVAGAHLAPLTVPLVVPQVPVAVLQVGVVTTQPPETSRQFGTPQSRSLLHLGGGVVLHRPVAATQPAPFTVLLVLPHVPMAELQVGTISSHPPETLRHDGLPQSESLRQVGGGEVEHRPVVVSHLPPATLRAGTEHAPEEGSQVGTCSLQVPPETEQLGRPQSVSVLHFGAGLQRQIRQPVAGSRWKPYLQARVQVRGGQGTHLPAVQVWSAGQSFHVTHWGPEAAQ